MSARAIVLGILLGVLVAGVTYFNDAVIAQTFLIGNFLPIGVFGALMILLMLVNPALRALGKGWPLRPGELAVITALGLAVCGWPSSGFFRTFTTNLAMPSHLIKDKASWQEAHVMSYVPGGSPLLGEGHVQDWTGLASRLARVGQGEGNPADRLAWNLLTEDARRLLAEVHEKGRVREGEKREVLKGLNQIIESRDFYTSWLDARGVRSAEVDAIKEEGEFRRALDGADLPAWARTLLAERWTLGRKREALQSRHGALDEQRKTLLENQAFERERLKAELAPLRKGRETLARELDAAEKRRDLLRKAQLGTEQAPDLEMEALGRKIATLKAQTAELEVKIRPLDKRLARLDHEVGYYDNEMQRLVKEVESLDRRTGTPNHIGRIEKEMNRALLAHLYPEALLDAPKGQGALLAGGEADPFAVEILQQGWHGKRLLGLTDLPWGTWWPTLRLWGGVAILMALAVLCLVLIVHPQWSKRELLAYPIARFVEEATAPAPGSRMPAVLASKLFWYGFVALLALHLVNGLNRWNPETFFIKIPTQFNFSPLKTLFPTASIVEEGGGLWAPTIYLAIVAFAFFLNTDVSLSIGLANLAWVVFGSFLVGAGIALQSPYFGSENANLILFGAYLGMAGMLLYLGRRYYLNVAASAVGLPRKVDTPSYATWAARGLVVCLGLAVFLLVQGGLDWFLALLLVLLVLLTMLVMTRVNAETGAPFLQAYWLPAPMIAAVLGTRAVSPQGYIMLAIATVILVGDPRETLMPYLANALRIGENAGKASPARVGRWLLVMVIVGFVVALVVTLLFQYNLGINHRDSWAAKGLPELFVNATTTHISKLAAHGQVEAATVTGGLEALKFINPDPATLAWIAAGLALVVGFSLARLRISWWFIHPVLFVVWGTYPGYRIAASFFVGWAIKAVTVKLGGAKGYQSVKPLMIGVIAGELLAAIGWIIAGAVYYWATGQIPPQYNIMPG